MTENQDKHEHDPSLPTVESPILRLVLVGDSDIARWPTLLLPGVSTSGMDHASPVQRCFQSQSPIVNGKNGATLSEVSALVRSSLLSLNVVDEDEAIKNNKEIKIAIACAGENDACRGLSMDKVMEGFKELLDAVFPLHDTTQHGNEDEDEQRSCDYLLFLGPKLGPWIQNDHSSRKMFVKLSNAMKRACQHHDKHDRIIFLDCLTLFCGDSANLPGAIYGGKATPETHLFDSDMLHLSIDGYTLWRKVINERLIQLSQGDQEGE